MSKYLLVFLFLACPAFAATLSQRISPAIPFEVTPSLQTEVLGRLSFLEQAWVSLTANSDLPDPAQNDQQETLLDQLLRASLLFLEAAPVEAAPENSASR